MKNSIIPTIQSKLNDLIKYRVVFDIDDVLCCSPIRLDDDLHTTKEEIEKRIKEYPGSIAIYWKHEEGTYLHFFYPDLDKLILSILSWSNWSIDFFSSGVQERNEEVIPAFLKQCIARYSDNVDEHYQQIVLSGRCRIFSRQHMKQNRLGSNELKGFEKFGQYKKDLIVISEDIDNTILVDDDRSYVVGSQYPFIGLSYTRSSRLQTHLQGGRKLERDELLFDPIKSPPYMMGILLSCKELLESEKCNSLRKALDLILQHNEKTLASKQERDYSPWFLSPTIEAGGSRSHNVEFIRRMNLWIKKAEQYWSNTY